VIQEKLREKGTVIMKIKTLSPLLAIGHEYFLKSPCVESLSSACRTCKRQGVMDIVGMALKG
jgi:hypothetical protein